MRVTAITALLAAMLVGRSGVGEYTMKPTSVDLATGGAHAMATGWNAEFCRLGGWSPSGVKVRCHDPAGSPVDSTCALDVTGPWLLG